MAAILAIEPRRFAVPGDSFTSAAPQTFRTYLVSLHPIPQMLGPLPLARKVEHSGEESQCVRLRHSLGSEAFQNQITSVALRVLPGLFEKIGDVGPRTCGGVANQTQQLVGLGTGAKFGGIFNEVGRGSVGGRVHIALMNEGGHQFLLDRTGLRSSIAQFVQESRNVGPIAVSMGKLGPGGRVEPKHASWEGTRKGTSRNPGARSPRLAQRVARSVADGSPPQTTPGEPFGRPADSVALKPRSTSGDRGAARPRIGAGRQRSSRKVRVSRAAWGAMRRGVI
jgi:hypothetical protein